MSKRKNVRKAPREMTHRQLSHHKKQLRRQRMFLFGGIIIIIAVIGIIFGGWLAGEYLPLRAVALEIGDVKFDVNFYMDTMVLLAQGKTSAVSSELSNAAISQIERDEIVNQQAEKLGFTVTDEEVKQNLRDMALDMGINIEINDATMHLSKSQLLINKLIEGYFTPQVPESDVQLHVMAMMVESESVAGPLRERILAGENFTALAEQYAGDVTSKDLLGDYGWHPVSLFKANFASIVPYDYVSRDDANAGDVSQPLADNLTQKEWGYWLIRVNEMLDENTANVSALYLSSEDEALNVRAQLEAGADLGPIAESLSQFSISQVNQGEIGLVTITDNVTDILNGYVFGPDMEIGEWSQPVWDDENYSKGGVWLVKIEDKEEDRPLSTEDRNLLISRLFYEWSDYNWAEYSSSFIDHLDADLIQWALDHVVQRI